MVPGMVRLTTPRTPSRLARILVSEEFFHRSQKPTGRTGTCPFRSQGGRYRDDELVARSERDGEVGCVRNCNPDATMSRDVRNAAAAEG